MKAAEKFERSLADGRLEIIDQAGHLPQIEQPQVFIEKLTNFIAG